MKAFSVYSYVFTNMGERYKKPFARFCISFIPASFSQISPVQVNYTWHTKDLFIFLVLITANIKQFANYHFFQVLKLHNMASPKTRRVLSELRTKDENDVSPQYLQ